MHDSTLNGHVESGPQKEHQRTRTSGSRKCNCCPYGYHLDLDFVRYCEKVASSQLLQSARHTIPRIRAGRKKRESIESLLGIASPQAQTSKVNTDTFRSHAEEKTDEVFSDALEKAVSDFEKMLKSSSRPKSADEPRIENVTNNITLNLEPKDLRQAKDKGAEPTQDSKIHINGANNDIRQQMAASLSRMRQLEEEAKLIPNLQNQVKKLRWENRRLTKLLESKTEAYEKSLRDQTKVNEIKEDNVRHTRTIGTGCTVLRRDVAVSNEAILTTTGTNTSPPDPPLLPRLIHRETNTDFSSGRMFEKEIKKRPTYSSSCQTSPWPIKPITLQCGAQTDLSTIKVPATNVGMHHEARSRVSSPLNLYDSFKTSYKDLVNSDKGTQTEHVATSPIHGLGVTSLNAILGRDEHIQHNKVSTADVGIQHEPRASDLLNSSQSSFHKHVADIVPTRCVATQYEYLTGLVPTSKTVSTQVVPHTKPPTKRNDFGTQVKPLTSEAGIATNLYSADNSTQTLRYLRKDVGINVSRNTPKTTSVAINTDSEEKANPPKPIVPKTSRFSDTQDLCKKSDACVGINPNLVDIAVDTHGLKEYSKKDRNGREMKKIRTVSTERKENLHKSHSLQHLKKHEEVSSTKGVQERISPTASVLSKPYEKKEPSKEMKGAMKVLNDSLLKSPSGEMPKSMRNAVNIIQQEWFKISSTADANPLDVEDYLDCFEELSVGLLEYIVNMTDVSGNTAMHYAVSNGNFDVVSILLDSKVCNINKLNTAGYTCIMLVALTKVKSETDRQVVRRLFHMADVNIRAKQHGQTALMLAVSHGRIDTVELLLESGADINIQDEDGSTALMCAAEHGYIDIVKLLLAQPDCDLTVTDLDGNTALNIAMEAGNRDIGVLLYAQEHFSRGNSPFSTLKSRRAKSSTPTLKTRTPTPPNCPQEHSL